MIRKCFGSGKLKKYNIALMRKYKGFSYEPTSDVIKRLHNYLENMDDTNNSDHRKMIFFVSNGTVMAVLIGSSNFSPTTYIQKGSSEADLLLINDRYAINSNFITLLNTFARELNELNYDSNIIVSKSLHGSNFLQESFEKVNKEGEVQLIDWYD